MIKKLWCKLLDWVYVYPLLAQRHIVKMKVTRHWTTVGDHFPLRPKDEKYYHYQLVDVYDELNVLHICSPVDYPWIEGQKNINLYTVARP